MKKKVTPRGREGIRIVRQLTQKSVDVIEREKRKVLEYNKENEDTKIRREINEFILAKVFEGKSKEDILKRLKFIFHAEKYKPYWKWFEIWIDETIKRKTNNKSKAEKDKDKDESEKE